MENQVLAAATVPVTPGVDPHKVDPTAAMADLLRRARGTTDLDRTASLINKLQPERPLKPKTLYIAEAGYRFPSRSITEAYARAFNDNELLTKFDHLSARQRHARLAVPASDLIARLATGVRPDQANVSAPDFVDDCVNFKDFDPTKEWFAPSAELALELALRVIQEAASPNRTPSLESMIVTLPYAFPGESPSSGFEGRWIKSLKAALGHGWDATGLLTSTDASGDGRWSLVQRTIELAGCTLPGRYTPYLLPQLAEDFRDHYILVPEMGVVQLTGEQPDQRVESASYFPLAGDGPSRPWANALASRIKGMKRLGVPILQLFSGAPGTNKARGELPDYLQFTAKVANSEMLLGARCLVNHGLSIMTAPDSVNSAREQMIAKKWGVPTAKAVMESRERCRSGFLANVAKHRCRDIVPRAALQAYLTSGRLTSCWDIGDLGRDDVDAHVRSIVTLLTSSENYELAIVDDEFLDERVPANWLVKNSTEGGVLLIETGAAATGSTAAIDAELNDPVVARAFASYFDLLWESVPLAQRERTRVIATLQRALETRSLDNEPMTGGE